MKSFGTATGKAEVGKSPHSCEPKSFRLGQTCRGVLFIEGGDTWQHSIRNRWLRLKELSAAKSQRSTIAGANDSILKPSCPQP